MSYGKDCLNENQFFWDRVLQGKKFFMCMKIGHENKDILNLM